MRNAKDYLMDFKTYILLVVFFVGIGVAFAGVAKIPEKVKEVEKKVDDNKDGLQQLAVTVDKYILEQRIIQQSQDKREELMLKLIEKK